ncbi:MAG: SH3 domain-containing protein [Bacillota bacterium]
MKMLQMWKVISMTAVFTTLGATVALADEGKISTTNVNIRSEASIESTVLAKVDNDGTTYSVLGVVDDWYKISYNGKDAFVSSSFFDIEKADGAVSGAGVFLRSEPNKDASVLAQMSQGSKVVVTGKVDDWYQLSFEGIQGYASKDFIEGVAVLDIQHVEAPVVKGTALANTYGVINSSTGLKLRSQASTDGTVLAVLQKGTVTDIENVGDKWVKAIMDDGTVGYLSKEFVSVETGTRPAQVVQATVAAPAPVLSKGQEVISYAKQFLGTPYSWGGTNLNTGVDCSGFVFSVMKNFGISLNRSSSDMANNGVAISKGELQAGDLVFFNAGGSGGISHVGIALGNGQYIHSSSGSAYSVVITDLDSSYSAKSYVTARRVL